MSQARSRGPIVIDTDVFSADVLPGSQLATRYAPLITGRSAFISFQTATELRYGAVRRGWGQARMLKLTTMIQRVEVVHTGLSSCSCARSCALIAKRSATRSASPCTTPTVGSPRPLSVLEFPLVSNDKVFRGVPGLAVESLEPA